MAFQISSMAFQFSSTAFLFPRHPRKSIYGGKYTKDHHSSFVFPATCSPSFVIATRSPSFVIAIRSPSFVIATRSPSLQNIHTLNILWTMRAFHPTTLMCDFCVEFVVVGNRPWLLAHRQTLSTRIVVSYLYCLISFAFGLLAVDLLMGPEIFDLVGLFFGLILLCKDIRCLALLSTVPVEAWRWLKKSSTSVDVFDMNDDFFVLLFLIWILTIFKNQCSKNAHTFLWDWTISSFEWHLWCMHEKPNDDFFTLLHLWFGSSCIAQKVSIFGGNCNFMLFEHFCVEPHESRAVHMLQDDDLIVIRTFSQLVW